MRTLRSSFHRLSNLFRKEQLDRDLSDELASHLAMHIADNVRAGMSPEEARRSALLKLGGVEQAKESMRDRRGFPFLEALLRDLSYAFRMLAKDPRFTAVAVLTLALGIGATTAIFSVLNAVMLQSMPVRNPQELVVMRWSAHAKPQEIGSSSFGDCHRTEWNGTLSGGCSFSFPTFKEIRARTDIFSNATAFAGPAQLDLSGNGAASIARGELVSGDYFQTFGVSPALGRMIEPADEQPGAEPVVVLNYRYWQSAFGCSPGAVGRTIRLNGIAFTIIGVTDPRFTRMTPGKSIDLWLPLTELVPLGLHWGRGTEDASNWWLTIVARLKPKMSMAQAQSAASLLFRNEVVHGEKPALKDADHPEVALLPAEKGLVGIREDFAEPLYILMVAVGIVLMIACSNVAGLMFARAASRKKEVAVRLALGAGRGRVIQQFLTESVVLSVSGGALGVLIAYWGASALALFLSSNWYSPVQIDLRPDAPVLIFTITASVLTGIVFGVVPAFSGTRVNVAPVLKENSGTVSGESHVGRRLGLGSWLVVAQVALSVVALIGAGLMVRTVNNLRSVDAGFDTRNILLFAIDPALADYKDEKIRNLYDELERRLAAMPGVVSVSYSSGVLLDNGLWTSNVHIEGHSDKSTVETNMLAVGPEFLETMRIPLLQGRTLRQTDFHSGESVAIVNEAFVHQFLAGREPIGVHFGGTGAKNPRDPQWEIVGIVADAKYDDLRKNVTPTAYIPLTEGQAHFTLRTGPSPTALIPAVRRIVNDLDSEVPIFDVRTQSQAIDRLLFNERLLARLSSLFGLLALALACIGLYGLVSYEVARRTREIGIRIALGAQRRDVLRLVVGRGFLLVFVGALGGILTAIGVTRYLQSLLFGVRPTDPMIFLAVCLVLAVVTFLACFIPAQRATRVDLMTALRSE
jgi:predicted permease